jgi:hypothetical protein
MRRKRKDDSIITVALESRWPVAAMLSGGCLLIGFVLLPGFFAGNVFLKGLIPVFRPFLLLGAGGFGLIAFIKWSAEQAKSIKQESGLRVLRDRPVIEPRSEPSVTPLSPPLAIQVPEAMPTR